MGTVFIVFGIVAFIGYIIGGADRGAVVEANTNSAGGTNIFANTQTFLNDYPTVDVDEVWDAGKRLRDDSDLEELYSTMEMLDSMMESDSLGIDGY